MCELLRANLYEFQKYNRESGEAPYFTLPHVQSIARQVSTYLSRMQLFVTVQPVVAMAAGEAIATCPMSCHYEACPVWHVYTARHGNCIDLAQLNFGSLLPGSSPFDLKPSTLLCAKKERCEACPQYDRFCPSRS